MPLRLDIKRKLSNRSERVKAVDFHPTEPWLLTALYNGSVHIWNYETLALVKTFETCDMPVRASKFIARKSWLVTGSDDLQIRVFNYNTHEKVTSFEAHVDYIRSVAIHPVQPLMLTCSDDMLIKMWNWDKNWKCVMTFEGHTHFVMQVVFNPKDHNTFASACMDRTVKIWSLNSPNANFTLEGHQKGVNSVDYYPEGDKPYLVSAGDDKVIKVWDYQNKTCVQTLEGHSNNVSVVIYHPSLPIIISGSEDGTIRIWHSNTYRLENTLNYGMERVWALAVLKGFNDVAFGYDEGTISIQLGKEEPSVSMDSGGKIIWAKHNEIQTANIKSSDDSNFVDGEKILLSTKDLGSCEIYPQYLLHSPNGRFVVVCGDGEFIIYTALAWRNKAFGQALEFVWAQDSNEYAIRESTSRVRLFKAFKEKNVNVQLSFSAEGIFGGTLLGIRSSNFLIFFDWETGSVVRRVDIVARNVYWSDSDLVCISSDDAFYILKFNRAHYQSAIQQSTESEDGFEEAFEFVTEVSENVVSGSWVGDCFIYTTNLNRLNYLVGVQSTTISHFDKPVFVLGYLTHNNRIFVCDRHMNINSYSLPLSLIEYQTAVLRGDMNHAHSVLPNIPQEQHNKIARFLETQGHKEEALHISTDLEHKFELAMQLGQLKICYEIASELQHDDKWKSIGDIALQSWNFGLALDCWKRGNDLESLLLMYQASGNAQGLEEVSFLAKQKGEVQISFMCLLLLGQNRKCLDLLLETKRYPEAAFFSRTFVPDQTSAVVTLWKKELSSKGRQKIGDSIADPSSQPELFPTFPYLLAAQYHAENQPMKQSVEYPTEDLDLAQELKQRFKPENVMDAVKQLLIAQKAQNGQNTKTFVDQQQPIQQQQKRASPEPKQVPKEQISPKQVPKEQVSPKQQPLKIESPKQANVPEISPRQLSPIQKSRSPSPVQQASIQKPAIVDSKPGVKPVNTILERAASFGSPTSSTSRKLVPQTKPDFMSDNISHMSLEVNTTGTGSLKGDLDFEFDDFGETNGDILDDKELEDMLA